jgi:hypothetical protein
MGAKAQSQRGFVLIGPFGVEWAGEKRVLVRYKGESVVSKQELWLDASRIHNAYVDGNKHYYFIYETENVDFYLQYATKLPSGAGQVGVLRVPYGCKYFDEDEEVSTSMEGCWEAHLADGVEWVYKEIRIPNDADPGQALAEYRPDLNDASVIIKLLERHGIKVWTPCRLIEVRGLGEGVDAYGIRYRDAIGFNYCFFYDDPWPTATRFLKLRIYYTNNNKIVAVVTLGEVPVGEVTDEELKRLGESEVLAIAAEYDDEDALEILRRTGARPSEFWLLERKPSLIPYFADEVVARVVKKLRSDVDAYKNPNSYKVDEKILAAARKELVEEYEKLMGEVMRRYEEYVRAEEERRRREEGERRRKIEELASKVKAELEGRGIAVGAEVEVKINEFGVEVKAVKPLSKAKFNEYLSVMKTNGLKYNPKGRSWYRYFT